jgi:DNA invertase Pin-like site-specific DNA recombinase
MAGAYGIQLSVPEGYVGNTWNWTAVASAPVRVFEDHETSGAETKRCGLSALFRTLKKGDVLVVWRLDRLGRSVGHLIETIERLKARGVEFESLTEKIDTGSPSGRMIFHVLAAMTEFERSIIRERTLAGTAAARLRGRVFGRRRLLSDGQCQDAFKELRSEASGPMWRCGIRRTHEL